MYTMMVTECKITWCLPMYIYNGSLSPVVDCAKSHHTAQIESYLPATYVWQRVNYIMTIPEYP